MIERFEWTEEGIQQVATLDEAITASSDVSVFILADLNLSVSAHHSLRARIQAGSSGERHSYKEEEEKRAFHASAGGGSRADPGLR